MTKTYFLVVEKLLQKLSFLSGVLNPLLHFSHAGPPTAIPELWTHLLQLRGTGRSSWCPSKANLPFLSLWKSGHTDTNRSCSRSFTKLNVSASLSLHYSLNTYSDLLHFKIWNRPLSGSISHIQNESYKLDLLDWKSISSEQFNQDTPALFWEVIFGFWLNLNTGVGWAVKGWEAETLLTLFFLQRALFISSSITWITFISLRMLPLAHAAGYWHHWRREGSSTHPLAH